MKLNLKTLTLNPFSLAKELLLEFPSELTLSTTLLKESTESLSFEQIAQMIGLDLELDKRARGLTADVQQKISLGRGMVREDVNAILFDEPLTVIDPQMKWDLRTQLSRLQAEFGHTMIYVTHDQTEALSFADKVAVMFDGQI